MRKNNLLSISELSDITGVNAKSLRYYDRLGILPPAFVDPDSGYRYYAFYQKEQVDAIQLCVEMGIPLKSFSEFDDPETPNFRYGKLLTQGTEYITDKIRTLQAQLARLQFMQTALDRAEDCYAQEHPKVYPIPKRLCWIVPYNGIQLCDAAQELCREIILEVNRHGLRLGYSNGLLLMRCENEWKQFLFVDIDSDTPAYEVKKHKEVLCVPEGECLCQKVERSGMDQVWTWSEPYVKREQVQLVIETELFIGNYYFPTPVLEQQCLLYP